MITPEQARTEYGFIDCTSQEDDMALGIYQAARALFPSRFMQIVEYSSPAVIAVIALIALAGILTAGLSPFMLFMPAAMAFAFFPYYQKISKKRKESSGMCHVESELGRHFLIAYGTCSAKHTSSRKSLMGELTDHKLRIVFSKHRYLDDVRVMKELYDQIGEGSRVCLLMADHANAKQIIAAPANFADTVMGKKQAAGKLFDTPHETTIRTLTETERRMYLSQYQEKAAYWNKQYGRKYLTVMALFFVFGCITLAFAMQGATLLSWVLVLTCGVAFLGQKREFRDRMKFMQGQKPLTAVDVTARREDSWNESVGTAKRSNSAVSFKDQRGITLWTVRTSEDLRVFHQNDKAILIIYNKVLLPFHRDTEHFRISE